jgi:hypothetical protein
MLKRVINAVTFQPILYFQLPFFFFCLFYDAVSISYDMASNGRMAGDNELESILKETVVAQRRNYTCICVEGPTGHPVILVGSVILTAVVI